ncbi:conserved hypothetical protein [Coccidioides posadasii str. Silveira]|uniref:Uncharacterized protein n=2 Tax=Coccidioides posadasii TaxID=199306 RepID=E9D451_COCPS|nr:conserved hypothetical protein [Coccidioides posadasii str. Silveira]KMM66823.1 hypothetical protein CPAG_03161 [Coccidioides posadasii RMSCC 3488]
MSTKETRDACAVVTVVLLVGPLLLQPKFLGESYTGRGNSARFESAYKVETTARYFGRTMDMLQQHGREPGTEKGLRCRRSRALHIVTMQQTNDGPWLRASTPMLPTAKAKVDSSTPC